MISLKSTVFVILLVSLITASAPAMQSQTDWDELGPNVMIDDEARSIIEVFDKYYRSLNSLMCKGEVRASLREYEFDGVMFLSARAQRPNRVEVVVVGKNSPFPTNIFISNGTELFEQSVLLSNYMISPVTDDFQSLHDRVSARSAPNVPVEIITSLMSDAPMRNLLQLSSEAGLIRLIGTTEVNGVKCNEISVNEFGTRVWISAELPPRLMRYQSSPALMKPRYLPEGAIVTGPEIVIDFKSWGVSEGLLDPWEWSVPKNSNRMATMHENAAAPGPEVGFDSMNWDARAPNETEGPALTRINTPESGDVQVDLAITVGSKSPDARLFSLDGMEAGLNSIRDGRPSVVLFWVPGGKFSRSSMPGIIRSARSASDRVIIIPIGSPMTTEIGVDNITMPVEIASWCDPDGAAAGLFGVFKQPAVFVIESDGTISDRYIGPQPLFAAKISELVTALEKRQVVKDDEKTPVETNDEAAVDEPSGDDSV
jgi:hypothetical protein